MDRTGQTLLGKYTLTRLLGQGGMGEVWEGDHAVTGRRVAIKVLSEKYLANQKVVKRFGREARAASAVHHPGIVEILDQDRTPEGVPFLVMEFLEGESLGDRLRTCSRLSQEEALEVMLPLLDALDAAHTHGVIHRDLKPDNVYLLPDGRGHELVKILDFGISQKADEIDHKLTQEGSVLGTPHYMSPEQARGELGIDARADIYAAAVLLYELVVGDVPFDADNYNALLQTILMQPPVAPRERGAQISQGVEQVVLAALSKQREMRPDDAKVFRAMLVRASEAKDQDNGDGGVQTPVTRPHMNQALPTGTEPGLEGLEEPPDPFSMPMMPPGEAPISFPPDCAAEDPKAPWELDSGLAPDPFANSEARAIPHAALELETNAYAAAELTAGLTLDVGGERRGASRAMAAATTARATATATATTTTTATATRRRGRRGGWRGMGGVLNWVVALVLVGGVVFFVRKLFDREPPRRRPAAQDR